MEAVLKKKGRRKSKLHSVFKESVAVACFLVTAHQVHELVQCSHFTTNFFIVASSSLLPLFLSACLWF